MTVKVTLGEMIDHGCWKEFCALLDWDEYYLADGLSTREEECELTMDQAAHLGLLGDIGHPIQLLSPESQIRS